MTTYFAQFRPDDRGPYEQVATVEMKVGEALEQGLLQQIADHIEGCSDDSLRTTYSGANGLTKHEDYVQCPRCALLRASRPDASRYLLESPLRLRVIVQIKHLSPFDYIRWD